MNIWFIIFLVLVFLSVGVNVLAIFLEKRYKRRIRKIYDEKENKETNSF